MCSAISRVLPTGMRGVWFCAQTTPARTKIIGAAAHLRRSFICLFCDCQLLLTKLATIHRAKAANNHLEAWHGVSHVFSFLRVLESSSKIGGLCSAFHML